ncbi:MAG: hypothetical protein H7X92_07645, partial [Chitinophagales bacterium]|nr:hypothetical protein [Hyphomicrobiales bacterium]
MNTLNAKPADFIYVHIWLILFGVMLFGFFIAYDMNFIRLMLQTDRSYLSGASLIVFLVGSIYAFYHIVQNSRMIAAAEAHNAKMPLAAGGGSLLGQYLNERSRPQPRPGHIPEQPAAVIEIYADRLRAPVELG